MPLFADDMTLYIENPEDSAPKLNRNNKQIQNKKSAAFLYTNNETSEKEVTKIIPFAMQPKG